MKTLFLYAIYLFITFTAIHFYDALFLRLYTNM